MSVYKPNIVKNEAVLSTLSNKLDFYSTQLAKSGIISEVLLMKRTEISLMEM